MDACIFHHSISLLSLDQQEHYIKIAHLIFFLRAALVLFDPLHTYLWTSRPTNTKLFHDKLWPVLLLKPHDGCALRPITASAFSACSRLDNAKK